MIFDTNMSTAYMAGRHKQMTDPDVLKARPYWMYDAVNDSRTRPEHRAWDNLVLPADDPWWNTHYPPNGWGCRCSVRALGEHDLRRLGKGVNSAPDDGTYEWTDSRTGEIHQVPNGIDPGWDYNVGKAAWGEKVSEEVMAAWKAQGEKVYERLTPGDHESYGRKERIPVDSPVASVDRTIEKSEAGMRQALRGVIGGHEKAYSFSSGDFRYDIYVNADTLAGHIDVARAPYIPFLPETLTDPFEVWMSFEKHKGTGQVVLRQRVIKAIETGDKKGMLVVTNVVGGKMEAWTFIPVDNFGYLNKQRVGKLIWKRN
ncbi:MAG: minor capsid protein [Nitrospirae bacterium]|nr:minor capsid protein [Nitrospirota bacterium]